MKQAAAAMWSETDLDTEQQLLGHHSLASSQAGTLRLKENGHGHSLGQQVRASNEPSQSCINTEKTPRARANGP